MSNFLSPTVRKDTGEAWHAEWLDDYFGRHVYGVRFPDGTVLRTDEVHDRTFEAVMPFRLIGQFVVDAENSRVLTCFDDGEDCDRRYSEDRVNDDPHFICECGRLGQRMEEISPSRCGLE
ncbi:MAG: hypothetical protein NXI04_30160 [Planctomycetaceae bacterium]|nr:hypothetical protein [Planctomycetaceae bacterium]